MQQKEASEKAETEKIKITIEITRTVIRKGENEKIACDCCSNRKR